MKNARKYMWYMVNFIIIYLTHYFYTPILSHIFFSFYCSFIYTWFIYVFRSFVYNVTIFIYNILYNFYIKKSLYSSFFYPPLWFLTTSNDWGPLFSRCFLPPSYSSSYSYSPLPLFDFICDVHPLKSLRRLVDVVKTGEGVGVNIIKFKYRG